MRRNHRPVSGRAPSHRILAWAALLAVAALVAPLGVTPARAGWSTETPVTEAWSTRPAVAMDAAGHLGVAWQESSAAAGIRFATDATGIWATETVSSGDDWSPDLVFGSGGSAHVAFARFGAGAGLYLATKGGGGWTTTRLRTDPLPWSPSLAIDAAGKLHVAYASEGFTPGIWYLTNRTGAWVSTRVTTGTWDSEPSLALDPAGKVHVAFARYEGPSPGLFIATNASGAWAATRLTTNEQLDDFPALVIDAAGRRHVAALRGADPEWSESTLVYLTDGSGSWAASQPTLPAGVTGIGLPAIGLDGSGEPEIVVRLYSPAVVDDTLWRFGDLPGGTGERLADGKQLGEEFPDVLRGDGGRLTVAYRGAWHAPGILVHRADPDEDAMIAPSAILGSPSLDTDGTGARHIAFDRRTADTSDGTSYASDASGAWTHETVGPTHGRARLVVHASGGTLHRAIAIPDRLYRSSGTGWQVDLFQLATGTEVAMTQGGSLVAYAVPDAGIRLVEPGSGETELTWYGGDPMDRSPAIDRDLEIVVAFVRRESLCAMYRSATGWHGPEVVDASSSWDPAIATTRNSLGTSHIVYDRHDSDRPGIWLATGGAWLGTWETRRISRSWADARPAIALDGENRIYVAWHRSCWGPSPGIYLATNRTGSWVTTQLVGSCDAINPSISILPDGRIVVAYLAEGRGISVVAEVSPSGTSATATTAAPDRSSRAIDDPAAGTADGGASLLVPAMAAPQRMAPVPAGIARTELTDRFAAVDR